MKSRLGTYSLVALLISILTFNLFDTFIPHHHHEGRICLQSLFSDHHCDSPVCEDETGHDSCMPGASHDLCEGEQAEFDIPANSFDFSQGDCLLMTSILHFIVSADVPVFSRVEFFHSDIFDFYQSVFYRKSHRLRGSPAFS